MKKESDVDRMVKAMGVDNFKRLQSDMASIADKFKERTIRYQDKVSIKKRSTIIVIFDVSLSWILLHGVHIRPADFRISGNFLS